MITGTSYRIDQRGVRNSTEYRVYHRTIDGQPISGWHDIPVAAKDTPPDFILNMVVEVPRWTAAWMTFAGNEPLNPIRQHVTEDRRSLRYFPNLFPFHGCQVNFGYVPQTWCSPAAFDSQLRARGSGRPVRVFEVGERVAVCGEVLQVKVLGCFATVFNETVSWMVYGIDINDPNADLINDIDDLPKYKPQLIRTVQDWFYRFNNFYMQQISNRSMIFLPDGRPHDKHYGRAKVWTAHQMWLELIEQPQERVPDYGLQNCWLNNRNTVSLEEAHHLICQRCPSSAVPELPVDQTVVSKWFFSPMK